MKKAEQVRDLMVPIGEYATVSQEATIHEAILALQEAQKRYRASPHHHRAVLVVDETGQPVGKISHWVALRALEPKYAEILDCGVLDRFGYTGNFIRSIIESHGLWRGSLEALCREAASRRVKDVMYTPAEGEFIEEDAAIEQGIHQLVMGHHQSLLVTRRGAVVGVLRLIDVFLEICARIKSSR